MQKYFLLNKKMDFQSGVLDGMVWDEQGMIRKSQKDRGRFFSPLFDSREKGTIWHRLELWGNHTVEVLVFASENQEDYLEGKKRFLEEKEKEESLPAFQKLGVGNELLLYEITARYLWFVLRIQEGFDAVITKIKVEFPKQSWAEYLPDVYRQYPESFSFLERYLGIFQDLYQGVSKQIREVSQYFDPEVTKETYLPYLAEWVGLLDPFLWESEKLRYLIGRLAKLYQWRGTVGYLEELLELYIGTRPYIVENHQIWPFLTELKQESLKRLYGDSGFLFTVVIGLESKIKREDLPVIERIIENEKPVQMEGRIVILEPYIFLGWHTYLGMNSILSDFHSVVLDGQVSIPFVGLKREVENK